MEGNKIKFKIKIHNLFTESLLAKRFSYVMSDRYWLSIDISATFVNGTNNPEVIKLDVPDFLFNQF